VRLVQRYGHPLAEPDGIEAGVFGFFGHAFY
jgi:hypothetical protein